MVAIQRSDTKDWAIPGGFVDAGEQISTTLQRELEEEAGNLTTQDEKISFKKTVDSLFERGGELVYVGYVDDPRNTDEAWISTTAMNFHLLANEELPLNAGDDAMNVQV